jgi:hypothetical protein
LPLAQLAKLAERAGQAIADIHQNEGVGVLTAASGSATG